MTLGVAIAVAVWASIGAGMIKAHLGREDYDEQQERAEEEAGLAWKAAQGEAEAAMERARANLTNALGALGAHTQTTGRTKASNKAQGSPTDYDAEVTTTYTYETYDDWYNATKVEYDEMVEAGHEGSWLDYLHEQQQSELGEYGIARAELEITVDIARREFDRAEQQLDKARQFLDRSWGQKAGEAIRAHQQHQSMAGASGMRSGTAHETAREYQMARMEGLNLWREEALYQIQGKREEIGAARERLDLMEDTTMAKLDAFLAGAREGFEFDSGDIFRRLGDIHAGLDFELGAFSDAGRSRVVWTNFFDGMMDAGQFAVNLGGTAGVF